MYFVIDAILLVLLVCVFWFGIKKGLTGNWIFNILRTLLALGGGVCAAVGLYFLMDKLGWLDILSDGVVGFFGNIQSNGEVANHENFIKVCKIVAFIPFGILTAILGYVLAYWLLGLVFKVISVPLDRLRDHKVWRIIDNILGSVLNLAIFGAFVLAIFGAIHGLNENDKYKEILGDTTAGKTVNHSIEVVLNGMNENLSAGPLCGLIYEYNPLNGTFANLFGSSD